MRRFIFGFVAGIGYLQTCAILPSFFLCSAMCLSAGIAAWLGFLCRRVQHSRVRLMTTGCWLVTGVLTGIVWASGIAAVSLADSLDKALEGRDMTVIGVVDSLPDRFATGTRFVLRIERVLQAPCCLRHIPTRINLSWYTGLAFAQRARPEPSQTVPILQPGERWQLTVRLKRPHSNANPMGFDAELRALEQGIRAIGYVRGDTRSDIKNVRLASFVVTPHNMIGRLRAVLRDRIHAALPGKSYAGVIAALVVGDQKAITPQSWDVFRKTGISHLVAISGLHITLVAGTLASLFGALWRRSWFTKAQLPLLLPVKKASVLAAVIAAWGYVLLAGFGVPAQRALYMLMVIGCAKWYARLTPVSYVLLLALFVVVACDPWAVLSAGFWLSFGAVAIIMYASSGRNQHAISDRDAHKDQPRYVQIVYRLCRNMKEGSRTQYVVTLGLLPLTIILFGQYSLIGPIANAVAIPVVTLVVAPLSLIGCILPQPLSTLLLLAAHSALAWLSLLLQWLSDLPFAVWTTPIPHWWMFIFASVGMLLLLAPKGWPLRWLGCFGWLPLLLNTATSPKDHAVWLTAFDVGQGMSLLIETAHHRLLYDTGPSYSEDMDTGKRIVLPYLAARGIDALDTLVVSHSDDDHAGGALSVMNGVSVRQVMSSLGQHHAIVRAARSHQHCERGQHWMWDGVQFMFLHPTDAVYRNPKIKPNGRSCVLRITAGNRAILLAGDIEAPQEKALVSREYPQDLHADILLVPHHGSGTSSTEVFLSTVHPSIALFQMGYLNRFHHPKPVVWERYAEYGVMRLRSDTDGAVSIAIGANGHIDVAPYRTTHARYWYGR